MIKKAICFTICMLIWTIVAQAEVSVTYTSQGKQHFSMIIPDDWRVNVGSEKGVSRTVEGEIRSVRLMSAMPSDGVPLWFGIWVPEDLEKIEEAEDYMDSLGLHLLTDVVTTERKLDTVHSMKRFSVSGTGKKEGEAMDFYAAFFQLTQEHVAIAIYIGPPETTSNYRDELTVMIRSLHPVINKSE